MPLLREILRSFRASPVFALAVLVTFGLAGLNGLMILLMQLQPGFLGMAHFTEVSHRTHDLTFSFLFIPAIVGMLAQLRRPLKNVTGQMMALVPWAALILTFILTNDVRVLGPQWVGVAAATLIATILHPTWRDFFRSFRISRINRGMLVLVVIAAVPLLTLASTNVELQGTIPDNHAAMGHYGFIAAFGFTVIGIGLLASLRPDGWWLPAWVAGLLPALLGLTSLVYPNASSSLELVWALAAIAWGIGFVVVSELTQNVEHPTLLGSWGILPMLRGSRDTTPIDDIGVSPTEDQRPGTPGWVSMLGAIALVLVVLWIGSVLVTFAMSGGPGGSGPVLHGSGGNTSSLGATPPNGEHEDNTPPIDDAHELAITADQMTFNLAFGRERLELAVGQPVNVALTSIDIQHDLVVDEIDFHLAADPGETVVGGMVFDEPGTYIGYCSVPGHREAGMEFEIVVTPSE